MGGTHREYIQGFVTVVDTSPQSGGFAVVQDSHMQFADLKGDPSAADYTKAIIPALKRGDLLLWDARALHCNCPGDGAGRLAGTAAGQAAEPQLLRATVHMCLSPKSLATEAVGYTGKTHPLLVFLRAHFDRSFVILSRPSLTSNACVHRSWSSGAGRTART